MWHYILLAAIGLAGGILGGMGMGGGTLLIPLLTSFAGIEQHAAQGINLAAFIPMAAVSLIVHFKNKLVSLKPALLIAPFALVTAVPGAIMAAKVSSRLLGRLFGGFLLLLGIWQLVSALIRKTSHKISEGQTEPDEANSHNHR